MHETILTGGETGVCGENPCLKNEEFCQHTTADLGGFHRLDACPTAFKVHIMGATTIHREMSILEDQTPYTYGSQARILVERLC